MAAEGRPETWTEAFSGKLGHVFGDHDDTLAFLDGERASWDEHALEPDRDASPADDT
jgi:hypothetical protein